jgi:CrcB protein
VNLPDVLWVGLGGTAGALARFFLDGVVRSRVATRVPLGTVTINLTGSFALGLLTGLVMYQGAAPLLITVAGTGFCGGYTTFSTASFETVQLLREGELGLGLLNAGITLGGALAAGALGLALAWIS